MDDRATAASDLSFRPLRRSDLSAMQRWLSLPHVDEWWHEAFDRAGIEAKYLPRIDGKEPTHVFVIEHGREPIGWIQWYRWADYAEHAARLGAEPESAGIDLAIGEPKMLGIGLGSAAIRKFVEQIVFSAPAITACVSDPETRNERSWRAFASAGFAIVATVQLPGEAATRHVVRRERPR